MGFSDALLNAIADCDEDLTITQIRRLRDAVLDCIDAEWDEAWRKALGILEAPRLLTPEQKSAAMFSMAFATQFKSLLAEEMRVGPQRETEDTGDTTHSYKGNIPYEPREPRDNQQ